jgi:hypothetical protein
MEDRTGKMLNIRQVRDRLGLSYTEVINLVRSGKLRAYRYAGSSRLERSDIQRDTQGLRFRASDIDELVEASLIT